MRSTATYAEARGTSRIVCRTLGSVETGAGLELARAFYESAVRPILDRAAPGLRHSAARIGRGSEVLGFDDRVSQDHDWGPRLELFLDAPDHTQFAPRILDALAAELPRTFAGFPTSFTLDKDGVGVLQKTTDGDPIAHRVEVNDFGQWCQFMLAFDPRAGVTSFDWLATSSHRLAEVTSGAVFHDGLDVLGPMRKTLAYYPQPVWCFVLASQWRRIGQEEAFVGRCAQVGDGLGVSVIAGRLTRDVMRLCLMMERQYVPYSKWLGTAFARLGIAATLTPHLSAALHTDDGELRQRKLAAAYEIVATRHNELALIEPIDASARPFWNRGFPVILADRFAFALQRKLAGTELAVLPLVGSVDQFLDSTDVLGPAERARAAARGLLDLQGTQR
jgi:hypothetical protein